jgi:hypothetical protein
MPCPEHMLGNWAESPELANQLRKSGKGSRTPDNQFRNRPDFGAHGDRIRLRRESP